MLLHFRDKQATENKELVSRKFACEFLKRDTSGDTETTSGVPPELS